MSEQTLRAAVRSPVNMWNFATITWPVNFVLGGGVALLAKHLRPRDARRANLVGVWDFVSGNASAPAALRFNSMCMLTRISKDRNA